MNRLVLSYGASLGPTKEPLRSQKRECADQDTHCLCRPVISSRRGLCRMPPAQEGHICAERRCYPRSGAARDSAATAAAGYVSHTADACQHSEGADLNHVAVVRRPARPTPPPPPRPTPPPPPPRPAVSRSDPVVGGPPSPAIRHGNEPEQGNTYLLVGRETCLLRAAGLVRNAVQRDTVRPQP